MLTCTTRPQYTTLLDSKSLQRGDETAITFVSTTDGSIHISRTQLRDNSLKIASALQALGIQPDDLVMIVQPQSLKAIYMFWGCLMLGAIPSMLPTLTPKLDKTIYAENLAKLVQFSGTKAILTQDDFAPHLAKIVACKVIANSDLPPQKSMSSVTANPNNIALLQHSSGTTGLQKGVALSHRAILNQSASYSDALSLSSDDVIVSWLPLYHDMGLIAGFLLPLINGIPLVLMSPFDWVVHPAMLLKTIDQYKGTLCWLPNFAYNHMARRIRKRDLDNISLKSLRAFINCSEPVRDDSHQLLSDKLKNNDFNPSQLAVSYAMAENTFAVTQTPVGEKPYTETIDTRRLQLEKIAIPSEQGQVIVSCGKSLSNTKIKIVDDHLQQLTDRHIGQVLVKSNCMLTEYHNRPDLQPFVDGWYKTGDMGYLAEGHLFIVGRKKDLIINGGKNVYPQDIEAIVNKVEGVHAGRCVVFGVPDKRDGTELIAVVAELKSPDLDQKIVTKNIRQAIASQSTVTATFITFVESGWLIKTSSGKIARDANCQKWLTHHPQ